jgi:iron complex transport system substrate-binding protein
MATTNGSGRTPARAFGRRSFLTAMGTLPLVLAACSGGEQAAPSVTAKADAFPVTVEHAFGTTTIDAPPTRVVVLGAMEADICASLGLAPVAMPGVGNTSWFRSAVTEFSGQSPLHLDDRKGVPHDEIEELEPDLILAMSAVLSQESYDKLSGFAPVITSREKTVADDWRTMARTLGHVLGREEAATTLIETTEEAVKVAVQDYADLKGATVLYMEASTVEGADVRVHAAPSTPMRVLREFGLADAPALGPVTSGRPAEEDSLSLVSHVWPRERAAELSADVLLVAVSGDEMSDYRSNGELPGLPAFGAGQIYFLTGTDTISMENGSPLSMEWVGRNLVPEFAKSAYLSKQSS